MCRITTQAIHDIKLWGNYPYPPGQFCVCHCFCNKTRSIALSPPYFVFMAMANIYVEKPRKHNDSWFSSKSLLSSVGIILPF